MRILIAHNRYQLAGGEDTVVALEAEMLVRHGHDVETLYVDNMGITGATSQAIAAVRSFYSLPSHDLVKRKLAKFQPDILHVHNTIPTLSPSIYYAAQAARVPVVQTLHNYRLVCANAQLFRDGHPCEDCLAARSFLPGVRHACYRGSRAGSAILGAGTAVHGLLGTWAKKVDRYIALTEFFAEKLANSRVPRDRIRVKPNFASDQGVGSGEGGFALFVGRLSQEKGLDTIFAADVAGRLPVPVLIVGDGPMADDVRRACSRPGTNLRYLGKRPAEEVCSLMKSALVLLVPSLWYEAFGMVTVEALSTGLPVIASRIGSLPEIVEDGVSGLLHTPGSADELTDCIIAMHDNPQRAAAMRVEARKRYISRYTEAQNYTELVAIYSELL